MTPRSPILGPSLAAWCIGMGIVIALLHDNVPAYPWTPLDRWFVPTLFLAGLAAAIVTWWQSRPVPLPPIRRETLRAILELDDPCGHIIALTFHMAQRNVVIRPAESDDKEPDMDCVKCGCVVSFARFSRLIVAAMQGRN